MHETVARLQEAGLSVEAVQPSDRWETRELARLAGLAHRSAVIACGGDGTVHDVLQGLTGTGTALGVVPAGSGDDVAGSLGLATGSVARACSAIIRDLQEDRRTMADVGVAVTPDSEPRYFASVLCTGFDARVNARANTMGRWFGQRYTLAMLRELTSFTAMEYTIDSPAVAGSPRETVTAMIVSIGNGAMYGSGMRICPNADTTDGLLDVTILHNVSRARLLWSFRLVFSGAHIRLPYVETIRVPSLTLSSPGAVAYADGEHIGDLPVTVSTRPAALATIGIDRPPTSTP